MSIITTKATVLSSLKYGETSLIVKCFTEQEGLKSYLIKGVLSSKKRNIKAAYFQPLNQLSLTANHHQKSNLHHLKEVHVIHPYKTIYADIVKQSVVLFLSEMLTSAIKEEEQNIPLYNYLESGLNWLDVHDKIANFHLLFLLNLTNFLGFYPDVSNTDSKYFNLLEGNFTSQDYYKNSISDNELYQFKKLLGINFDSIEKVTFSKNERQLVLKIIIEYFKLHLGNFKNPNSLQVLETIFS